MEIKSKSKEEIVANAYEQGKVDDHNDVWKDAHGDYLPDIDREVIVLIQDYPEDDEHLRVAFGHRPDPNGDSKTYGVGGWNIENVKYWLDAKLPNDNG